MTLAARVSLLVAATVLSVPLVAERLADALPPRTLAGRLLVATESMGDRRFARTVIYLVRHDPAGALGVIVNVPIAEVPFDRCACTASRRRQAAARSACTTAARSTRPAPTSCTPPSGPARRPSRWTAASR
jgi:hypothetical protein